MVMKPKDQNMMGNAQASQPRGGLLGLFDKAMKTNEETGLSPLQNFAAALDPMILPDLRGGQAIRQQGVQRVGTMSKNKTVDMLRKQGRNDLADAVMNGTIGAKEAFGVMQNEKAADTAFRRQQALAGGKSKDTALIRNALSAGLKPGTEEYSKYILSGGDVYGTGAPVEFGTLSKDTMMVQGRDEQGNLTYKVVPIPGSKAAVDAEQVVSAENAAREGGIRTAGVVLTNIDAAQEKIKNSKLPIAGFFGSQLKKIPGTSATDVSALVTTIKSNIGFDKLQAMRDASPTGGALGQVSNQEINFLQSTLNNLNQEQSQEQFEGQLQILENIYLQMIEKFNAYPDEAKAAAGYTSIGTNSPVDSEPAPDFTKMSDEELKAYIAENGKG
tara:strand:+ start:87 stop:1244 length:1158 start_codon:yes stop_codon:yes gene_type:complete